MVRGGREIGCVGFARVHSACTGTSLSLLSTARSCSACKSTKALQLLHTAPHDLRNDDLRHPLLSDAPCAMMHPMISGISMARCGDEAMACSTALGRPQSKSVITTTSDPL